MPYNAHAWADSDRARREFFNLRHSIATYNREIVPLLLSFSLDHGEIKIRPMSMFHVNEILIFHKEIVKWIKISRDIKSGKYYTIKLSYLLEKKINEKINLFKF